MALENEKLLDETGWQLLHELQQNARLSFSELGQRVGLSSPAVAERVRKMEDAGIITGYHAEVDPAKLGFPVMAIIRMTSLARSGKYTGASSKQVNTLVNQFPEVIESYRATGSDITIRICLTATPITSENYTEALGLMMSFAKASRSSSIWWL
jgi:Lrp/AsnC family transcriptional regulator, leucine-responsive regulatory protein